MNFTEIVNNVKSRANLTSPEATARIGVNVNKHYKKLTAGTSLQVGRRVSGVTATTTPGVATVTFTGIEKIERLFDDHTGSVRFPDEWTYDDIRKKTKGLTDTIGAYAIKNMGPDSVTVELDVEPQTAFTLTVDGLETADTLSGTQVPQFPESYHDILEDAALAIELRLKGLRADAKDLEEIVKVREGELRYFIVKSGALKLRQSGATNRSSLTGTGSGSSGGAQSGTSSYTQTGLVTFDRDPGAPFAVTSGSAMVANLDADKLDGYHAVDLIALMGDVFGPASAVANHVVFFNGTTGKLIKDSGLTLAGTNTGDVSLAGQNYLSIVGQSITAAQINLASHVTGDLPFANFVQASAASKLAGRGSAAGAGDFQEISLGTGLSMSGTTLNAAAQNKPFIAWGALGNAQPASAYATLDTRNGHPVLDFDGATDEEAVFGGVLSSDYQGGGLTCEIYVAFTSATSGNVRFQAAIERIDASSLDIDADSFASFQSAGGTAPGTSGQVIKLTITFTNGANMDSLAAGEAFRLKIRRDADGTSGTDDITTDAEVLRVVLRES